MVLVYVHRKVATDHVKWSHNLGLIILPRYRSHGRSHTAANELSVTNSHSSVTRWSGHSHAFFGNSRCDTQGRPIWHHVIMLKQPFALLTREPPNNTPTKDVWKRLLSQITAKYLSTNSRTRKNKAHQRRTYELKIFFAKTRSKIASFFRTTLYSQYLKHESKENRLFNQYLSDEHKFIGSGKNFSSTVTSYRSQPATIDFWIRSQDG